MQPSLLLTSLPLNLCEASSLPWDYSCHQILLTNTMMTMGSPPETRGGDGYQPLTSLTSRFCPCRISHALSVLMGGGDGNLSAFPQGLMGGHLPLLSSNMCVLITILLFGCGRARLWAAIRLHQVMGCHGTCTGVTRLAWKTANLPELAIVCKLWGTQCKNHEFLCGLVQLL